MRTLPAIPGHGGSGYPGINGENLAYVYNPTATPSGASQVLSSVLQANVRYSLSIYAGFRNGGGANGWGGSELDLLAGNTVIATTSDSTALQHGSFELQTATVDSSALSQSLLGQALTVRFESTQAGVASDWDNISLNAVSTAPEPSTLLLVIPVLGLLPFRGLRS